MNTLLSIYLNLMNSIKDEEGQDMVEYALLIGLISIVAVAALITAGDSVVDMWDRVTTALVQTAPATTP